MIKVEDKKNESIQKIKCNVTDCLHNCIDDSSCRLDCIKVGIMSNKTKAKCEDGTCCTSYDFGSNLNESEKTGGN